LPGWGTSSMLRDVSTDKVIISCALTGAVTT
jgi:hypothetical protein